LQNKQTHTIMIFYKLILFFLLTYSLFVNAQDTIRIMQYNLLYYGANTSFCNQTNNNINTKDDALRQIIDYVKPDIFAVNEISTNPIHHQRILDSILNRNQTQLYKKADVTNYSSSIIGNGLFYNSEKLSIYNEYAILGGTRDFNVYTLFYNSPDLSWSSDTAFITCIVVHLKAGFSQSDVTARNDEAKIIMEHLHALNRSGNYILMGDLNVYDSDEPSFQRFISHTNSNIRFYDPIHKIGSWSQNPTYANYHTQSTHTQSACHVGGGMDDRFDFIMTTMPMLTGSHHVKYVQQSYVTLGQDGQRFKKTLIDEPLNVSAPWNVIMSLYVMSDHLPVYLDFAINQTPASIQELAQNPFAVEIEQIETDEFILHIYSEFNDKLSISIYNIQGIKLLHQSLYYTAPYTQHTLSHKTLASGIYIFHITNNRGDRQVKKLYIP